MQSETADVVVFKCRAPLPAPDRSVDALTDAARAQKLPAAAVTVNLSLDGAELYAYLWLRAVADFVAGRSGVASPALPTLPHPAPLY